MKLINRKTYDKVRKMDHAQLSSFCAQIYKAGVDSAKIELDRDTIYQAVIGIKGVGVAKAESVTEAVIDALTQK